MKRCLGLCAALLLLGEVAGCGGGAASSPAPPSGPAAEAEQLVKEMIALTNQLADAVEKKDREATKELNAKASAVSKKLEQVKISDDARNKLMAKYKGELDRAADRLATATEKADK